MAVNAPLLCLVALLLGAGAAAAQPSVPAAPDVAFEEPVPGPPPPLPDLADPNGRTADSLGEPGPESGLPKALRGSAAKAGGPANELNRGGAAPEAPLPAPDLGLVVEGKALFHGNYCGAGQRGEGLPPIDALDAACQRHDACYDAAGGPSCACDAALRREAAAVSEQPGVSSQVRGRALSVVQATVAMACRAP